MSILDRIRQWFSDVEPLSKGMYQYRSAPDAEERFRLHLRVEGDGYGTLVINAAKVLHLNQTATEMARLLVDEATPDKAARAIARRYRVSRQQAHDDYVALRDKVLLLARTDEVCPITYLDVRRIDPFQTPASAPYRMDLALTYRCNNACGHCYVARAPGFPELGPEEWKQIIDRCWEVGIPHVTFTGGEATLVPYLRELIEYAEDVGLVTGLLTNGRRLSDRAYLDGLLEAGLDHIQITLESHDAAVHDQMVCAEGAWRETVQGIRNSVDADVYLMTNTTITDLNAAGIEETIDFIADLGVQTFACNGLIYAGKGRDVGIGIPEADLEPIMERVKAWADLRKLRLIWYTPTRYCEFNPLEHDLGVKGCSAARYNMAVEPNGDVLPCQSYFESMGNLLTDPWEQIWDSALARYIRDRAWLPPECVACPDVEICGGGCPLYAREGEYQCLDSQNTAG
ncbi:MAG: radical SAM protein [Anaerolineae bacterium]|nr:radical SAM protein [Anaerolineae bacterium]